MNERPQSDGAGLSPTLAARVEAACDRFEAAWRSGSPPRIEDHWTEPDGPTLLRELLVLELAYRVQRGERPEPVAYLTRFPRRADTIRDAFATQPALARPIARPARTPSDADRNLLFGVLALQMDFITREALIAAVSAWALDKSQPLDVVLIEQGALAGEERDLLAPLIQKHLERHGGDPERSLAALGVNAKACADRGQDVASVVLASLTGVPSLARPVSLEETMPRAAVAGPRAGNRFRVLRHVASGGLGDVFVARDEELRREVALKSIQKPHADDPLLRLRFRLEAEVTGRLEHPGIVPVYALGADDEGRPYYAMRFIRGETLKEAIERFHAAEGPERDEGERSLALRELLGRFRAVCHAIAFAHSRGVLHRDLKPGNVMLGPFGETLVVDWGLAKIAGVAGDGDERTDPGSLWISESDDASATQPGSWIGTPSYMSPEQAAGRIDLIGPASDIYSLGATLYHLLTGRAPFEGDDVFAALRKVQNGEFPPPRTLQRRIPPALEAICLRAMSLQSHDRYPSARAIADDLAHWLADEAVSCHREPRLARLARWSRRHRVTVASTAALLITAVVALAVSTLLVGREAARREEQRRRAEANFGLARDSVDQMLTEVAEVDLADVPQMQQVRKRLLEKARRFYQQFLEQKRNDPTVQREAARAHLRLGQIAELLGEHIAAEQMYREGLDRLATLPAVETSALDARADLARGRDALGMLLKKENRFKEAEILLRSALELRTRAVAENPGDPIPLQELADTRYHFAALLTRQRGRRREDEDLYREAVQAQESLVAGSRGRREFRGKLARYLNNLALLLASTGRAREAEGFYREAIALLTPFVEGAHPAPGDRGQLARSYANLAMLLRASHGVKEAEEACLKARDLQEALRADFPEVLDYQHELASIFNNLGLLCKESGNAAAALSDFREALELLDMLHAAFPQRPDYRLSLAVSRLNLASVLEAADAPEAARVYREALDVLERLTADFPNVAVYQNACGRTLYSLSRLILAENGEGARELLERAIQRHRAALEDDPRDHAVREFLRDDYSVLSVCLLRTGAHESAAQTAEELPRVLPDELSEHLRAAVFLVECGDVARADPLLTETRRQDTAEAYAARAVAVLRRALDRRVLTQAETLQGRELAPLQTRDDFARIVRELRERAKVGDG